MTEKETRQDLRRYEPRARIMKALAHPTRLFIVDQLAGQEYCVNELTDMVGCDMSTMSKHLSLLREAGIVRDEKRGACIYYYPALPLHPQLLHLHGQGHADRPRRAGEHGVRESSPWT